MVFLVILADSCYVLVFGHPAFAVSFDIAIMSCSALVPVNPCICNFVCFDVASYLVFGFLHVWCLFSVNLSRYGGCVTLR